MNVQEGCYRHIIYNGKKREIIQMPTERTWLNDQLVLAFKLKSPMSWDFPQSQQTVFPEVSKHLLVL